MSFQALSERLAALQESNTQLKELIERLATIKFQPGSIPLDNEDGNIMTELTSEIHQTLKEQQEDFELLQEEVYDLNTGRAGTELEQQKEGLDHAVKRAIKELKTSEAAFRKAQVSAKRSLHDAQRAERELLLQSYIAPRSSTSSPAPGQQFRQNKKPIELSKEEREVNASSDVTAALRRTHDMMVSELSRSQFAHDTLKESTAALAQLSETYSTLDTLLSSSKNLLRTLLRSQKSDTWYLETAFYVLLTTIGWLVFRRILYGPTWWLLWFPMKMFFKGWIGVFAAIRQRGGSSVDLISGSIASSSIVMHSTATGRLTAPSGAGGRVPTVNVGGGGRGAPMRSTGAQEGGAGQGSEESISDRVGKIIDESGKESREEEEQNDPGREGGSFEPAPKPNPKKRMWEEDKEAAKEAQRKKDEL